MCVLAPEVYLIETRKLKVNVLFLYHSQIHILAFKQLNSPIRIVAFGSAISSFLSLFLAENPNQVTQSFFCLSGSTLTLAGEIPARGGKMCDNNCSALSDRTLPFGLVCVQQSFSLRYLCV
jgi:hypothetical protein